MKQTHIVTALAIFAVTGIVSQSPSLAEAWQGNVIKNLHGTMAEQKPLIHKVGDGYGTSYSGMSSPNMTPQAMPSPQGPTVGNQPPSTEDYKSGSLSNQGQYGSNPSNNYFKKESSGSSSGPYGSSVYGGLPSTPSADPMIKELNRDPSMR
jgi:hypothetical protein